MDTLIIAACATVGAVILAFVIVSWSVSTSDRHRRERERAERTVQIAMEQASQRGLVREQCRRTIQIWEREGYYCSLSKLASNGYGSVLINCANGHEYILREFEYLFKTDKTTNHLSTTVTSHSMSSSTDFHGHGTS